MAGVVKAYGLTIDEVLYRLSYANVVMYASVIPSYRSSDDDSKEERIKADDPKNREAVKQFLRNAV